MNELTISGAFAENIKQENRSILENSIELGLDSFLEDGILKDIPFVSTAVSVYKIGHSIREKQHLKKMLIFLNQFNKGILGIEAKEEYIRFFEEDTKKRNKELEYIILILDRFINEKKASQIAKLYLAYLQEKLNWQLFVQFSEVLDRMLEGDYEHLSDQIVRNYGNDEESDIYIRRLEALGLVVQDVNASKGVFDFYGNRIGIGSGPYKMTSFGILFSQILTS